MCERVSYIKRPGPPYQCPNCGRYLDFKIDYFCGSPNIHYTCTCGYDTNNETTIATTSTMILPVIDAYKNHKISYWTNFNYNAIVKLKE